MYKVSEVHDHGLFLWVHEPHQLMRMPSCDAAHEQHARRVASVKALRTALKKTRRERQEKQQATRLDPEAEPCPAPTTPAKAQTASHFQGLKTLLTPPAAKRAQRTPFVRSTGRTEETAH